MNNNNIEAGSSATEENSHLDDELVGYNGDMA